MSTEIPEQGVVSKQSVMKRLRAFGIQRNSGRDVDYARAKQLVFGNGYYENYEQINFWIYNYIGI